MNIRASLLAIALLFAFVPRQAEAALVDFTPISSNSAYVINGTLAADAIATFEFTLAGLSFTGLSTFGSTIGTIAPMGVTSSPFTFGTSVVTGNAVSGFGSNSLAYFFPNGTNTGSPVTVSPVVFAIASLINPNQVEVTFTNNNALAATFNAAITYMNGVGFGQLVSASAVPLPSGILLFLAGLAALGALARVHRRIA